MGTKEDGTPDLALDLPVTRVQALVLLVKLLGQEDAAQNGTWTHPFTDVPSWADFYVGYAYAEKLTGGTSSTTFGSDEPTTATQYLSFLLKALGYSSDTDFSWDKAVELTDSIGATRGEYKGDEPIDRGTLALTSYNALQCKCKDSETTLLQSIQANAAKPEPAPTPSATPSPEPIPSASADPSGVTVDYEDVVSFEAALNNGEDLVGKTVQFVVKEVRPNTTFAYNLVAGEHLNFCSPFHPNAEAGDTVIVKVTSADSILGSWLIYYDFVEHETPEDAPAETPSPAPSQLVIDYGDAESFEAALNRGENLEGKIVQFEALELHPESAFGYNVFAGEHLNFVSDGDPGIKVGDTVVGKVLMVASFVGSWIIAYEFADSAVVSDATIFAN